MTEMKTEKARKLNTSQNQLSFSKFSQAWSIPDDVSSLSSLSSENSLDRISRLGKIEEVVSAWIMRNGDTNSMGRSENKGGRDGATKIHEEVTTSKESDLKRKPFSDISQVIRKSNNDILISTQNRAIHNQRKATLKSSLHDPHYLNKTEAKARSCPVQTQGQNDFGGKVKEYDMF